MTTALLSIHPRFSQAIIAGTKTVEIRRVIPKRDVRRLVIYETKPTMAVVAECDCYLITGTPERLWLDCRGEMGIIGKEFWSYMEGCENACAAVILRVRKPRFTSLADYGVRQAPQSWVYLDD